MADPLNDDALDLIFRDARSYNGWLDKAVTQTQIEAIYDLLKMGPTSANMQPARFVWCTSQDAKDRLAEHASDANKEKIKTAPACVIINEQNDVVYFFGRTGKYLEPSQGAPSNNLFNLARRGLRMDLRTAIQAARASQTETERSRVSIENENQIVLIG